MTDRRITIAHTYDERLINTAEICVESLGDISQPEHSPDMAASLEPLARWERRMRADGQASSTIKNRLINIRAMARFNGTEPHLLGRAEIDHWLDRELAPNSKNAYWRSANEWFHFLLDEGLIEQHPFTGLRKRPQPRQGLPRPLTSGEQRVVLETATPRMLAWLKLGLRAGLRVSETARIRGEYIRGGVLTILGKGGKTRIIPAHQEIIELAEEMPRIGPWFISRSTGGPITPQWLTCCVTEHFSNCGISGSYHRCRHSFATDLLAEGVDIRIVQELLGHESLNTTAIYTRVRESQLRDAVSRLPRVSGL